MTPEKKIKYVKRLIDEKVQISPKGPIHLQLYTLTEYEDGPTLISRGEQKLIIKKLEEDGYVKNVIFEDDRYGAWVEVVSRTKEENTSSVQKNQPIIKRKTLELIAIKIGELDSGSSLVEFFTNCGVKRELIEYPNTKWRMIYSVLLTLASSQNKKDKRTLFKIIEEACHPLMYGGDKNLAKKTADKFNNFLEYDNFFIKNGVLWQGWDNGVGLSWSDKDGNNFEDKLSYLIIPKQIDKLYVYWNELIKLAKFYFNNKDSQNDKINDIYFEIIANVEKLLDGNGCGGLKEAYKKPFRNMIGCEFEIQKQGLTTDGLFANLYDFLGKIIELSLPDKNNIGKIKKDNSAFFAEIKQYSKQHLARKKIIEKPLTTKIEITKIPELKIQKDEEILKLSPETHGVGINLKLLFQKFWKKLKKQNNQSKK